MAQQEEEDDDDDAPGITRKPIARIYEPPTNKRNSTRM
jgi:hypothetical protein